MAMTSTSPISSVPKTYTLFGWFTDAASCPSRRNRSRLTIEATEGLMILSANGTGGDYE